jgi:hypothetical protein
MSEQPKALEPVPVQLTRIEGTVNLIAYQMAEVKGEVSELTKRITAVELVQAQSAGASNSWKTWLPFSVATLVAVAAVVLPLFK